MQKQPASRFAWALSLVGTDLREADLRGANLAGADLRAASLTGADLSGARYDGRTHWPQGFDPTRHGAVKAQ